MKCSFFYRLQAMSFSDPTLIWSNVHAFSMCHIYRNIVIFRQYLYLKCAIWNWLQIWLWFVLKANVDLWFTLIYTKKCQTPRPNFMAQWNLLLIQSRPSQWDLRLIYQPGSPLCKLIQSQLNQIKACLAHVLVYNNNLWYGMRFPNG